MINFGLNRRIEGLYARRISKLFSFINKAITEARSRDMGADWPVW